MTKIHSLVNKMDLASVSYAACLLAGVAEGLAPCPEILQEPDHGDPSDDKDLQETKDAAQRTSGNRIKSHGPWFCC